jgi:hypothetical protein
MPGLAEARQMRDNAYLYLATGRDPKITKRLIAGQVRAGALSDLAFLQGDWVTQLGGFVIDESLTDEKTVGLPGRLAPFGRMPSAGMNHKYQADEMMVLHTMWLRFTSHDIPKSV